MLRINIPWVNDHWCVGYKTLSQFDQTPTSKALGTNGWWSFTGGKSPSFFLGFNLVAFWLKNGQGCHCLGEQTRQMSVWIHFLHRSIFEIHWYLSLSNLISRSPFLLVNLFILEILTSFNHTVRVSDQFRPSKSDFWQAAPQSLGIETPSLKLQVSPPETADVSPFPRACIPGKMDEKLLLPQKKTNLQGSKNWYLEDEFPFRAWPMFRGKKCSF